MKKGFAAHAAGEKNHNLCIGGFFFAKELVSPIGETFESVEQLLEESSDEIDESFHGELIHSVAPLFLLKLQNLSIDKFASI